MPPRRTPSALPRKCDVMDPVALPYLASDPEPRYIEIAKDQPQYRTLPALVYNDGRVLTEWSLTEDERQRLIRGERIRLWIWAFPQRCRSCGITNGPKLQPVALEITSEDVA
jgi:hypothetical protein